MLASPVAILRHGRAAALASPRRLAGAPRQYHRPRRRKACLRSWLLLPFGQPSRERSRAPTCRVVESWIEAKKAEGAAVRTDRVLPSLRAAVRADRVAPPPSGAVRADRVRPRHRRWLSCARREPRCAGCRSPCRRHHRRDGRGGRSRRGLPGPAREGRHRVLGERAQGRRRGRTRERNRRGGERNRRGCEGHRASSSPPRRFCPLLGLLGLK